MATVIKRLGYSVRDGLIHYNDVIVSYDEAEKIAGHKLDRRKNYAIIDGQVCDSSAWVDECTGCYGHGCFECGHQGRRVTSMWTPLPPSLQDKDQ